MPSRAEERIGRIAARLLPQPETLVPGADFLPDWMPDDPFDKPPVPAAVLIAIIRREEALSVLYTERSPSLRAHSGQVAFPGGKIDPTDASEGEAALREAFEEVGMMREDARILGFLPHYFTGTNYLITPAVALVEPSAPFRPNPGEVDGVFEVPIETLADERSYSIFRVSRGGREHATWQIEHEGHRIWGITANLTRRFRDLALREDTT